MRSHPSLSRRLRGGVVLGLLGAVALTTLDVPAATAAAPGTRAQLPVVSLGRAHGNASLPFWRGHRGEVFLTATVSARGVSWADRGNESAVVSAYVDGHHATDLVITSATPVTRQLALGALGRGHHTLRLHYDRAASRSDAGRARLTDLALRTIRPSDPGYVAARYAPVLRGRNDELTGGRFQNNHTDTPLLAWHTVQSAQKRGHSVIEYSVLWSNEDGGTNTPGLMAQWGRTTDIEWIYRVEVDRHGRRVARSGVFQSAGHGTTRFRGSYDGTHPLLQTCTSNNNVCDRVSRKQRDPLRFALAARDVLPADQPREHEMDRHPWTYRVMADEMVREGRLEATPDPATLAVGDQRTYLYVAVTHDTTPASDATLTGLAVDVRLTDGTTYTSNHGENGLFSSINRNGPAATTVELPRGTTAADVASISAHRMPLLSGDTGATLTVTRLRRAFLLDSRYRPEASFAHWRGSVTLTTDDPVAQLWAAP